MTHRHETEPLARLEHVSKTFRAGGREASVLRKISFEARPGELVLLLGPSGSGKSTFLTILAGLQAPTAGNVWLFGRELHRYSIPELQELRARRIGFIFQTFHLIDALNGIENVQLVMKFMRTPEKTARTRAMELLERLDIAYLAQAYPKTMSQGEKQRVAVARAQANRAALIIGDEPTGSLSTQQGTDIVRLLRDAATQENTGIVLASHDQRIAAYADRVFHLRDGEVVAES